MAMETVTAEEALKRSLDELYHLKGPQREAAFQAVAAFVHYIGNMSSQGGAGPTVLSPGSAKTTGQFKCPNCAHVILAEFK
jgi:hypothetical protein